MNEEALTISQEIVAIILSDKTDEEIKEALSNYHENDIAGALEELNFASRKKLYAILGVERSAEIVAYLDNVSDYLAELIPEHAANMLENMDADDAVDALEDIEDEEKREFLLSLMTDESSEDIKLIASFDEDQVGYMMTTNYVTIPELFTIKEAMRSVIAQANENDNINTIYTTDKDGKYSGAITLKDLICARDYDSLESIISNKYPSVLATEKISDCIERLKEYAEDSIPVLSDDLRIIGAVTSSDIVEAIDDEMSEDYAKLAGLSSEEDIDETLFNSLKKRIPWLVLLLGLGMVVSSIVGIFESVFAQVAIVVCFQSLVLGMAGNVGTQSLAVTIRVLIEEAASKKTKLRLVLKETRVGAANGLLLGTLSFVLVGSFLYLFKGIIIANSFKISGCVGIALFLSMLVSSFMGTMIPIFFHKIKIDPAVASGPLISTINDLVAVVTYYGLAGLLLHGLSL